MSHDAQAAQPPQAGWKAVRPGRAARRLWPALLAGALLGACQAVPQPPPAPEPYPVVVAPEPLPVEPPPEPEKRRPSPKRPAAKKPAPPADSTAAVPPLPKPKPEEIVGLTQPEAEKLLGAPGREEEKPPARIWTYTAGECQLRLFFYPEVESLVFRVLRYEVNPATRKESEPSCFDEVVDAGRDRA